MHQMLWSAPQPWCAHLKSKCISSLLIHSSGLDSNILAFGGLLECLENVMCKISSLFGLLFQVVSVTLDDWSDEQVDLMEAVGGNALANSVYENSIPSDTRKPPPDASVEERSDFIR
jgi:hypothetical protein